MKAVERVKKLIPRPGITAWSLFALQVVYFALFAAKGLPGYELTAGGIISMLFSFFTALLVAAMLEFLQFNRLALGVVLTLVLLLEWGMSAYHLYAGAPLDYSLVRDNMGISFSPESFLMISTAFSTVDVVILALFAAAVIYAAGRLYDDTSSFRANGAGARAVAFLLWIVIVMLPVQAGDEFTLFIKSAFAYDNTDTAGTVPDGYPYYRKGMPRTSFFSSVPSDKRRPNVILIMIESYNANFVEATAPDGKPYTPVFNALIKKGLYIDRFYGNSIQTCKGQESVFFSILPAYKGKLFVDYPDLNISGFPAILASAGYETLFFQAYHDLKFDNTYNSMVKAGFSTVKSFAEYRRKEDRPYMWGWGIEDGVFYERFFEVLDSIHAASPGKPVFAALATVGTHIPCDGMPVDRMSIYKNPKEIRDKYSNALRLSDSQLPRFFEQLGQRDYLKNTVVIITADHSFPMKEHGIYNNEKCFYDETFRIPFLVIWDGVVIPGRVTARPYSQIDIGPTIADMLGIYSVANTMTGISIFDRTSRNPVYLVQPYNGRYLQVVDYPFKYILHLQSGKEYLFDLGSDPGEKVNLAASGRESGRIEGMRRSLDRIHVNQRLIDGNRIRPAE